MKIFLKITTLILAATFLFLLPFLNDELFIRFGLSYIVVLILNISIEFKVYLDEIKEK